MVSEISLALEQRSSDWVASASELEHFNNPNTERVEDTFIQYSVQLRAKVRCIEHIARLELIELVFRGMDSA